MPSRLLPETLLHSRRTRTTGRLADVPGRHQHAINYFQKPKTEEQIALLRSYYEEMTYSFHPVVQNLEHEDPRMRALQADMVEWGFETQSV